MAKYVCDYARVVAIGNKLIEAANNLTDVANRYSSSIEGSISSWNGTAKEAFSSQSTVQIEKILEKAKDLSSFGQFIIEAANKTQETDNELASMNI